MTKLESRYNRTTDTCGMIVTRNKILETLLKKGGGPVSSLCFESLRPQSLEVSKIKKK